MNENFALLIHRMNGKCTLIVTEKENVIELALLYLIRESMRVFLTGYDLHAIAEVKHQGRNLDILGNYADCG